LQRQGLAGDVKCAVAVQGQRDGRRREEDGPQNFAQVVDALADARSQELHHPAPQPKNRAVSIDVPPPPNACKFTQSGPGRTEQTTATRLAQRDCPHQLTRNAFPCTGRKLLQILFTVLFWYCVDVCRCSSIPGLS
jgi:hypothetical protein